MTSDSDIQVLVVGAGVGGLSLAGLLQRAGIQPVVVERDETLEVPRGPVELWPECTAPLRALGVWDDVRADGTTVTTWSRRQADGTVVSQHHATGEFGFLAVDYARLRAILRDAVGDGPVHTGMAVQSLEDRRGGVDVEFENGVREQFDIVVGADGVHSRTRELLGGDEPSFCATTSVAFRIDADGEQGAFDVWTDDGAVLRVTHGSDQATGWLTVPTPVPGDSWSDATTLTDLCPAIDWLSSPSDATVRSEATWRIDDYRAQSDRRADGRVALLGDAAHACHRVSGVGTLHALDDAATLARVLVDREDPPAVRLAAYAAQQRSHRNQAWCCVDPDGPLADVESTLAARTPSIPAHRGRLLASSFEEDTRPATDPSPGDS